MDPGPETEGEQARLRRLGEVLGMRPRHAFALAAEPGDLARRLAELGAPPVEVLGAMDALTHVAPADRALAVAASDRMVTDGSSTEDLRMVDGSWARVHLFDLSGLLGVGVGVVVPRERMGRAAQPTERAPVTPRVGHCAMDAQGGIVRTSPAFRAMLGYPHDAGPVGVSVLAAIHPDDYRRNLGAWASMLASPGEAHRARYRRRRADGSWLWCETTFVNRLDDPHDPRVEAEVLDISAEMAAHEAVRTREQLLARVAERLTEGVLQLDGDRRVIYTNGRARHLLGDDPDPDALVGLTVVEDRALLRAAFDAALGAGRDRTVEVRVRPPGGGDAGAGDPGPAIPGRRSTR